MITIGLILKLKLKNPPDPSKILIQRNLRKPHILIWTKIISRNYIQKFLEYPEFPTLDQEQYFIDPVKNIWSSG